MFRGRDEQEGQALPALLLVVLALLFLAFAFAQVGSAGDQATQTQTVADSGAVAAAHILRDAGVSATVHQTLPQAFAFGGPFSASLPVVPAAGLLDAACSAASTNWSSNTHAGQLTCGALQVSAGTGSASVDVNAPAGEVYDGPLDVTSTHATATATARVIVARCPQVAGSAAGVAVADWIAQNTASFYGTPAPQCLTPADLEVLANLQELTIPQQLAAIGPPAPLVLAVAKGTRVEIVR